MLDGRVKDSVHGLGYHITPFQGLLNDPNGLVYFQGNYHVFHQLNPFATNHQTKYWGHLSSPDLLHWERQSDALKPEEWYEKDGIYSGSAIVRDELLYVFYTGSVRTQEGEKVSYQCLATSQDGQNFTKHGPLFDHPKGYTRHVRDPKVWLEADRYWLLLGAQTEQLEGDVLLYFSKDLLVWEFYGSFMADPKPKLGYMWECPDYFSMEEQAYLFLSPQGLPSEAHRFTNLFQSGYMRGRFEPCQGFVTEDTTIIELDRGFEFYAPQTFQVGEDRILFGWMGCMEPKVERQLPTVAEGWSHQLTVPRLLKEHNGYLYQEPHPVLAQLRSEQERVVWERKNKRLCFERIYDQPYLEITIEFKEEPQAFKLKLEGGITVSYDPVYQEWLVARLSWVSQQREERIGRLDEPLRNCHIYVDGSSLELFVNDGKLVMSSRYFGQKSKERTLRIQANQFTGQINLYRLAIHNVLQETKKSVDCKIDKPI